MLNIVLRMSKYVLFNKCLTSKPKSPSQVSERAISVIRLKFAPCGRSSLPPRAIIDQMQIGIQLRWCRFFVCP